MANKDKQITIISTVDAKTGNVSNRVTTQERLEPGFYTATVIVITENGFSKDHLVKAESNSL